MSFLQEGRMVGCYGDIYIPCWEYAKGGLGSYLWASMDRADQEECERIWVTRHKDGLHIPGIVSASFVKPLTNSTEGYLARRRIDVERFQQWREHWIPEIKEWVYAGSTDIRRIMIYQSDWASGYTVRARVAIP